MKPSRDLFRGLYAITGPVTGIAEARRKETLALAQAFLDAGVRVLQLRDKHSDGRALLEVSLELRQMTRAAGALFIVNDRLDIALMADADGVHVGQDDLPVEAVRQVAAQMGRPELMVGLSTHDLSQVQDARTRAVDYIGFGPIFATGTKRDALPPRGAGLLKEAVQLAGELPVVAIGGISRMNVDELVATGTPMAAVIGDVATAPEPGARARELHRLLLRS